MSMRRCARSLYRPIVLAGQPPPRVAEAIGLGFAIAPALVDPTAIVASSAQLGDGSYLNAGVVIGAAARLGRHVIVNRTSSIGHHAGARRFRFDRAWRHVAGLASIIAAR